MKNTNHFQRVISNLNIQIGPVLKQNEVRIIDNSRKGRYRLTIMPACIKTSLKWLREKYEQIKGEVIREREGA